MLRFITLSHAIRFTSSIIKDEFQARKDALWKKIEFQLGDTATESPEFRQDLVYNWHKFYILWWILELIGHSAPVRLETVKKHPSKNPTGPWAKVCIYFYVLP